MVTHTLPDFFMCRPLNQDTSSGNNLTVRTHEWPIFGIQRADEVAAARNSDRRFNDSERMNTMLSARTDSTRLQHQTTFRNSGRFRMTEP